MHKRILLVGSALIFLGITLGAFGAHFLKVVLSSDQLASFETGVRYQMYHGLALLFLGTYFKNKTKENLKWVVRLMVYGVILFSGSIYLLATKDFFGLDGLSVLGPVTPIGGVLLIMSWGKLTSTFWKNKQ